MHVKALEGLERFEEALEDLARCKRLTEAQGGALKVIATKLTPRRCAPDGDGRMDF